MSKFKLLSNLYGRSMPGLTYWQLMRTIWAFLLGKERIPNQRWLYVEITNVCNLKCRFCAYPKVEKSISRKITSQQDFVHNIRQAQIAGIDHFGLTPTIGDVFVDRKFTDKLEFLERDHGVVAYRFTTNLILPSAAVVKTLFSLRKLQILGISVYGHNEETFRLMTGGNANAYARLLKNLHTLLDADEVTPRINIGLRTRSTFPGVAYSDSTLSNMIYAICKKHKNVEVDANQWYDNWAGMISADDVSGLDIHVPEETEMPKIGPCNFLFHKNLLTTDGDVLACACRDVNRELKIGNVSDHGLDTILSDRNPALQKMIDEQMTGDFGDVCKSCTAYQSIYDVRRTGISLKDWRKATN
jgi:sulfatase maturation enzyme AslB (radical SAM superfamily)